MGAFFVLYKIVFHMYTVYALYSPGYKKIYIGFTSNLENRLRGHNEWDEGYTSKFRPWKLAYREDHETKSEALRREKQLKSAKGREFVWQIVYERYSIGSCSTDS
jgi:putative endonuclease